jgi:hypothetical protein
MMGFIKFLICKIFGHKVDVEVTWHAISGRDDVVFCKRCDHVFSYEEINNMR